MLDTTVCDKICQCLATGQRFSPDPPVSSKNKTDRHDITEILLKVVLNTIKQTNKPTNLSLNINFYYFYYFQMKLTHETDTSGKILSHNVIFNISKLSWLFNTIGKPQVNPVLSYME